MATDVFTEALSEEVLDLVADMDASVVEVGELVNPEDCLTVEFTPEQARDLAGYLAHVALTFNILSETAAQFIELVGEWDKEARSE